MAVPQAGNILAKLREHSKKELIELVKMHLSFLVDVTTEEWARIITYVDKEEEEDQKRNESQLSNSKSTSSVSSKSGTTKYFTSIAHAASMDSTKASTKFGPPKEKELASNIFGNPLSKESLRQAMILVDFLSEDENYKLEGIFRKSGTQERQQDLRFMLNNGVRVDLKANRFTPVDTSCVLKEFIQKLPEPLLTNNHFELYYELALAIKKETPPDEVAAKNEKRLKIVQLLLHLMPTLNRTFFISLMQLLNRVANALEVTKMDERSLATIFGQHILCPRNWTPKQISKNIETITDSMEFLLLNYDKLFSGPAELVLDAKKKLAKYDRTTAFGQRCRSNENQRVTRLSGDSRHLPPPNHGVHNDDLEDSDENNTVITFCQRKDSRETTTDQSLAELYAQVQAMPETPQKRKLIRRFNRQNGLGTPMQVTGSTKHQPTTSKWRSLIPPILRPRH